MHTLQGVHACIWTYADNACIYPRISLHAHAYDDIQACTCRHRWSLSRKRMTMYARATCVAIENPSFAPPLYCHSDRVARSVSQAGQDSLNEAGGKSERTGGREGGSGGCTRGGRQTGVSVAHMVCLCTGRHASMHAFVCACAHIFVHEYKAACTCVDTIMQIRPLARMIC